ncbi:MAG: UDP binding domain-containing protein, partial [Bacteroidales bacterium]|nr:UDP binding domain-containing protein [Bacteroidales bacterium]
QANKSVKQSKVVILGITFKENAPDIRNSRVIDIIDKLKEYGIQQIVADPVADEKEARRVYAINLVKINEIKDADCLVFAVAHDEFKKLTFEKLDRLFGNFDNKEKILIDVKSIFDKNKVERKGYSYWRL